MGGKQTSKQTTTGVIVERIEGLKDLINTRFDTNAEQHNEVIAHQKKTNGRVTRLESWKNQVVGALIIMNLILLPIAFIFFTSIIGSM